MKKDRGSPKEKPVNKGKVWQPNPKQIKMAELLINPEDRRTKKEKCAEAGITHKTLWTWMKDERFVNYVNSLVNLYTSSELSEVWKALIMQCKRGNVQAIKLFFELKEMLPDEKKRNTLSEEKLKLERERFEYEKSKDELKEW